ncbi:MAG: type II toxin-antitoxin system PemK/MazF family toxin [Candidatus Electrothrix sp. AR3]|nr:type II toxin-antitoxin system PemK/MazF family toxin [Candidatus Electrothrix sp. AR3]
MKEQRYAVYFADLNSTQGSEIYKVRPVVVVSQNAMNTNLETVVICPLTSSLHPTWRSQISCAGRAAEIAVNQIRTEASQLRKLISENVWWGNMV